MPHRSGRRARRTLAVVAAAALIALPVGAAHATDTAPAVVAAEATATPEADATTFRIATSGFVDTFNPFVSIYLLPTNTIRYVYEYLVQNSAEDGSPTKGLADDWEVEDDGMTWVYTLQDDLLWSDDEPITSADVVYTYEQMMTVPELSVANGNLVSNFESVEAPDDKTVVIRLKTPQAPNPGTEVPIVPKHIWEEIDDPATYANDTDVVGSGPYVLESYSANQSITLRANPNFWQGAPKVDRIQYVYYTNSDAQVQALRAGEVDFVSGLTPRSSRRSTGWRASPPTPVRDAATTRSASMWARSRETASPTAPATKRSRTSTCARRCAWAPTPRRCWSASWRAVRLPRPASSPRRSRSGPCPSTTT